MNAMRLAFETTDLFVIGIAVDLAGSYLLGRGVVSSALDISRRAMPFPTVNHAAIVADVRDRVDALIGLVALATGFVAQALGYWFAISTSPYPTGTARATTALLAGVVAAVVVVSIWLLIKRPLQRHMLVRIARVIPHTGVTMPAPRADVLAALGREAGFSQRVAESDVAYCDRVFHAHRVVEDVP
jgi:hypothetical protein